MSKKDKEAKKKRKKKRGRPNYNCSAKAFVEAWMTSTSIDQVMEKTSLPRNAVYARVNSYRKKHQLELPKMKRAKVRTNVSELRDIIEKHKPTKAK
jgi:hypothetical protein